MPRVELYTTPSCPFCVRAKRLLAERQIAYTEFDVSEDDELRAEIMERTGAPYGAADLHRRGARSAASRSWPRSTRRASCATLAEPNAAQ
jgi:glutaredoxin